MLTVIGNSEIAKYLDQLGMLSGILVRCGQPILASAIREENCGRDDGLVQYLLDLNLDRQAGTFECKPFEMEERLSIVTSSPFEKTIFGWNISLAKILVERGAPITDPELCEVVEQYRGGENYDFLSLLLTKFSQHSCAVPNALANAMQFDNTVYLVRRFLDTGLDPRGKVIADGSHYVYLYQLHGPNAHFSSCTVLERAAMWMHGLSFKTLLRATTWTAIETDDPLP